MSKAWYATSKKNLNKTHVCRWTVPDKSASKGNRQHDESFATRDEAYRAVFAMQERIASGEFDAKQYTFGEAAYHWLDTRNLKPITRDSYRRHIKNVLTDYLDLPLRDVAQMRRELGDLIREHPGRRVLTVILSGTCDLAMAEGELKTGHRLSMLEVRRRVNNVREIIPLSADQLNAILDAMPDRFKLLVLLMRGCGLRVGESLAMETDAIHDGYLEVKRGVTGVFMSTPKMRYEGFTPRVVPIPLWLSPVLADHIERFAKDGVLFPSVRANKSHNRYVAYSTINQGYYKSAIEKAGLPGFTTHQLRKNWATQLRNEALTLGIGFEDIEQWIGHTNLTRDSYAFQGDDVIKRGCKLSDPRQNKEEIRKAA
jgi:integrase